MMEFPASKPLPPIGTHRDEDQESEGKSDVASNDTDRSKVTDKDDDDRSSVSRASSTRVDKPESRGPRIMQKFRSELSTDGDTEEEEDTSKKVYRSVSFGESRDNVRSPALKETTRRKAYDGREVTFISLDTQTDWEWVTEMEEQGLTRPSSVRQGAAEDDQLTVGVKTKSEISQAESQFDDKTVSGTTPFTQPYNDEFGIPLLELSSDTDDSSDEESSARKTKDDREFIPSVGPPQILQYIRESEKKDIDVEDPESRLPPVSEDDDLPKDSHGMTHGMLTGNCEFCGQPVKPFPSVEQQLNKPPEELYCCNQYREFVEFVISSAEQMEEEEGKKKKMIDIKPHEHHGSKQERNAAKEKAVQRMRQRELERRAMEASGMQQNNFFASSLGVAVVKYNSRTQNSPQNMKDLFVARQMKTINYQLSSQKCMEEGWTLRVPSPLSDDLGDDVFTPEPLDPAMIAEGKDDFQMDDDLESDVTFDLRDRQLIEKFYESGQKFLTMFPDGTGNVFYPSGNLAILISSIKLGQYSYTIHEDLPRSVIIASFDCNGHGYCYYPNGALRLYIDQYGGIELDSSGGKRRRWHWKDNVSHVHAPPFQPICISLGMSRHLGLRVMTQENISLTFSAQCRSCRFNMGSRLKLVAPENVPMKEIEEDFIFLEEKKNHVEALLNKVATLLKFPNSPKIDKILPPLHVTTKMEKTDKLKKERKSILAAQAAKDKKMSKIKIPAV